MAKSYNDWVELWVEGDPIAQPRERISTKPYPHTYTPKKDPVWKWKQAIEDAWLQCVGYRFHGPCEVFLCFVMQRPKTGYPKQRIWDPRKTNDIDNLQKAVLDALNRIGFANDGLVVRMEAMRLMRAFNDDDQPGVFIRVRQLPYSEPVPTMGRSSLARLLAGSPDPSLAPPGIMSAGPSVTEANPSPDPFDNWREKREARSSRYGKGLFDE